MATRRTLTLRRLTCSKRPLPASSSSDGWQTKSPLPLFSTTPSSMSLLDQSFSICRWRRNLTMMSHLKAPAEPSGDSDSAWDTNDICEGDLGKLGGWNWKSMSLLCCAWGIRAILDISIAQKRGARCSQQNLELSLFLIRLLLFNVSLILPNLETRVVIQITRDTCGSKERDNSANEGLWVS